MVDTTPVGVVQRFVDGANARDLALMMSAVAPDAVFAPLPDGAPLAVGRDSVQAYYRRVLSTLPATSRVTVEARMSDGAFVVDREHFTETGARRRDHATWIYQVSGGLIRRAWVLR
ncbi:MAG TPA: nuclear transport factor 2 family protein [Chloroflexota bacterium]|nr:nuclear transport factor 2 family protein [Chloroflexota bacterium]